VGTTGQTPPNWAGDIVMVLSALLPYAWAGIVAALLFPARRSVAALLGQLSGLEIFGVKVAIAGGRRAMNAAIAMATKHRRYVVDIPDHDRRQALARADREQALLMDAQILWVDDRPSNNRNEARMLRGFGAIITFAASTNEAVEALRDARDQKQSFDLILSDISRDYRWPAEAVPRSPLPAAAEAADVPALVEFEPSHPIAGLSMLEELAALEPSLPVIFYIGKMDPGRDRPARAFGLTDRPDQLLQLTLDALARTR